MPKRFFFALALASASTVSGCKNSSESDIAPAPTCISGVVLGDRCWDGILIQVDSQFPIGKPAQSFMSPDSLGVTNVIAATNSADFGGLSKRGTRVYFTISTNPNRQGTPRVCTANQAPFPIPHLVLDSIYGVPCDVPNR